MKALRILAGVFLLAALATSAHAQGTATNTPADTAPTVPSGPVVMPPASAADTNAAAAPDALASPAPLPSASGGMNAPAMGPPPAAAGRQDEIEDIRPPFFFLFSWWPYLLALLGGAISILLFLWLLRLFRDRGMTPRTAYELALDRLAKARELMREEEPVPYAISVSETIRTYLEQRFRLPSGRLTTEEFLRETTRDAASPLAEHREQLSAFLQACDLVKFAQYQPTLAELELVHQRAVEFVQATKPVTATETAEQLAPAAAA